MRIMNFTFSPYGEIMNSLVVVNSQIFYYKQKKYCFVYTNILILVQV